MNNSLVVPQWGVITNAAEQTAFGFQVSPGWDAPALNQLDPFELEGEAFAEASFQASAEIIRAIEAE